MSSQTVPATPAEKFDRAATALATQLPTVAPSVIAFVLSQRGIDRMSALNDHEIPPVREVGRFIHDLDASLTLSFADRKLLGRLCYYALQMRVDHRLVPLKNVRVPPAPWNQFSRGSRFVVPPTAGAAAPGPA